jgi:RHS repeat-associated protein
VAHGRSESIGSQGPDYAALAAEWQARADGYATSAAALAAQAEAAGEAASEQESIALAQTGIWSDATERAAQRLAEEDALRTSAATAHAQAMDAAAALAQQATVEAAHAAEAEQRMIAARAQTNALDAQALAAETEAAAARSQADALTAQATAQRAEAAALEDEAHRQTELWSAALLRADAELEREASLRAEAAALLATVQKELDKAAWFRSRKILPERKPQDAIFNADMERQAQHFEGKVKDVTDAAAALLAEADAAHAAALAAQAEAAAAEAAAIAARQQALALYAAAAAAEQQAAALAAQAEVLLAQAAGWRDEALAWAEEAEAQMEIWSAATVAAESLLAEAAAVRESADAALASALLQADAFHAQALAAEAAAAQAELAMIAAQQLAQAHRAEQQQAAAEAAVQAQLAREAQVQADHYAALAADPPTAFSETLFAYDLSGHLIGEYRADGTVLREYAWLEDQPLALLVPGGLLGGAQALYYHVDQLNTPQRLTDASGRVVWDGVMKPFGAVEVTVAEVEQGLRFPGQQFDAETGLHYNYFRDYDPGLGRYFEKDPIGLAGGLNRFRYSANDPVSKFDPSGLACFRMATLVGPTQRSFQGIEEVEKPKWELLVAHGFTGMSRNPWLAILSCASGCAGAECYAKQVRTVADVYALSRNVRTIELCLEDTCDGKELKLNTKDENEYLGEERTVRRENVGSNTTILRIPTESFATSACQTWVGTLN